MPASLSDNHVIICS